MNPSRNLTLTEELEKLEQSITLTLQEIDHNFSRAHRTVTSSILPVVEDYAKHSNDVWEGSKFWKSFFEASANISLTNYEETPSQLDEEEAAEAEDENTIYTQTTGGTSRDHYEDAYRGGGRHEDDSMSTADGDAPTSRLQDEEIESSSLLDSHTATVSGAPARQAQQDITPKARIAPKSRTKQYQGQHRPYPAPSDDDDTSTATTTSAFADYPSPYETLKQEIEPSRPRPTAAPATPRQTYQPALTPSQTRPSPFKSHIPSTTRRPQQQQHQQQHPSRTPADPLLHRVLDRTYRIQATPHTARRGAKLPAPPNHNTEKERTTAPALDLDLDSSPFSPDVPAPQLRPEIFASPSAKPRRNLRPAPVSGEDDPRTPGVSVQRPRPLGRAHTTPSSVRGTLFAGSPQGRSAATATATAWSDDEDEDDSDTDAALRGMSPPKTLQFSLPESRVVRTPVREAGRRIVEGVVRSAAEEGEILEDVDVDVDVAGMELRLDFEGDEGTGYQFEDQEEGGSPSVVRGMGAGGDGEDAF